MSRVRAPLMVAAARLRAHRGRSLLVVLGVAATTAMLLGVTGGSLVARDRAVVRALTSLPAADRGFRVDAFGLPHVREGEIVTLIGSNGAGKSTTLRSINGLIHPRRGRITFQGKDITNTAAHHVVGMGISQSPEGRRLFPRMSVTENLEMGAFQRTDKANFKADMDGVFTLFPRLAERRTQKAGTLSGGEQQMCAIGRALMARPKLLMLDEPSLGLAPIFVERIFETVIEIKPPGDIDPARGAERADGAGCREPRLRPRDGHRRAGRPRPGAPNERAGPQDLPRRRLGERDGEREREGEGEGEASLAPTGSGEPRFPA